MKVLITGANGLLGQKLVDLLRRQSNTQVIATARGADRLPSGWDNYAYDEMDITNARQVASVIENHRPSVIIHAAAMTQVDDCELNREKCWRHNVTATGYLLQAAKDIEAHFVFVSSDFVFDGSYGPLNEEAQPSPVNYYGESKLAAENLVKQSLVSSAIVRTVLVYGVSHDMSRSNIVLWVKKSLEAGQSIRVVTDQWRTPTLAEDLAMGCWLVAKNKAKGTYHISGEEMFTPYEMAMTTADFFDLDRSLIHKTDASQFSQPGKRPAKTGFIIQKSKTGLGYQPHTLWEGLEIMKAQI